jgi:Flp pilus assembly protein TadG
MTRFRRCEGGQTAVEFALILPILILILMGVFDFGRAFYAYSVVANSAREGARAGVYANATNQNVTDAINRYWIGLGTNPAITISPSPTRVTMGTISVTVSYVFQPVTPLIDAFLPGGHITLVASSVMGVE